MTSSAGNLSLEHYPYSSRRLPVLAQRGVVATSEPLAAQAGISMMQRGGNAVDAAIATAIALTVVEPTCNGIGGDAVALVWDGKELHGLQGVGRAPCSHTPELFDSLGLSRVPSRGWLPVTVPGAPAAWKAIHDRFGKLPWSTLFEPAISYAEEGFPVAPVTAQRWHLAAETYKECGHLEPAVAHWGGVFTNDGVAPVAGQTWQLRDHASTLRSLAKHGSDAFYSGVVAERILEFCKATGGYLTEKDLLGHTSTWVKPISTKYRGRTLWTLPPTSQGVAALVALNILEGLDLPRYPRESPESYHLQIEAIKVALATTFASLADTDFSEVPWREWLTARYAAAGRERMGYYAHQPHPLRPPTGDTVYLSTADRDGIMVSFMQSNYSGWLLGFGSGVVVPGTGIALHARGAGFTLDPRHPNCIAPMKRPFHTLAPSFLTAEGRAIGPFGIMGGPVQTQAQVQFIVNQIDYKMNPQSCIDAPRFQWISGTRVEVESSVPASVVQGLLARRHLIVPCVEFAAVPPRLEGSFSGPDNTFTNGDFGKGQIIWQLENGVYCAGSDWRSDGCAVGY